MASEHEILLRTAVVIGDQLVRITDAVRSPVAGVHIHTGVEMLRAQLNAATGKGPADAISRTADMPSEFPAPDA